ncbi:MAG: DUF3122 domain-containing protein [Phormidesmis sp.]
MAVCSSFSLRGCFMATVRMLFVILISLTIATQPAFALSTNSLASIHTYHEAPGQTTFRSKQSLRDRSDRSWQVILFKRYQADELQGLYLRLIGFPGLVVPDSQKSLKVATGASAQWQVQPALDPQTQSLPDNAAQYEVTQAIADLAGDIPLQIDIPLADSSTAQLVVPPFAVHEWRDLNAQSPT